MNRFNGENFTDFTSNEVFAILKKRMLIEKALEPKTVEEINTDLYIVCKEIRSRIRFLFSYQFPRANNKTNRLQYNLMNMMLYTILCKQNYMYAGVYYVEAVERVLECFTPNERNKILPQFIEELCKEDNVERKDFIEL